jgi:hypothetical protein
MYWCGLNIKCDHKNMCIYCRGNVCTLSFRSNVSGMHIQTHRRMNRIDEVGSSDDNKCHNLQTNIRKDWFRHLAVVSTR